MQLFAIKFTGEEGIDLGN